MNRKCPPDGIIASLTRRLDVHDRGIVTITEGLLLIPDWGGQNAGDLDSDSSFFSQDIRNSWWCYDFKDRHVRLTHYSIRSRWAHHRSHGLLNDY
jgi:hypothetical protein